MRHLYARAEIPLRDRYYCRAGLTSTTDRYPTWIYDTQHLDPLDDRSANCPECISVLKTHGTKELT
jgi:hypothetical protein